MPLHELWKCILRQWLHWCEGKPQVHRKNAIFGSWNSLTPLIRFSWNLATLIMSPIGHHMPKLVAAGKRERGSRHAWVFCFLIRKISWWIVKPNMKLHVTSNLRNGANSTNLGCVHLKTCHIWCVSWVVSPIIILGHLYIFGTGKIIDISCSIHKHIMSSISEWMIDQPSTGVWSLCDKLLNPCPTRESTETIKYLTQNVVIWQKNINVNEHIKCKRSVRE